MASTGVVLACMGLGIYLFGLSGRLVERRWSRLDPKSVSLTPAQQFALGRQKAIIRQGPMFRKAGAAAMAIGVGISIMGSMVR